MDIKTFKQVAPTLLKNGIVPYLHGKQGIGKTAVVKQIGKEMGFDSVICVELGAQGDVGDIIGLLRTDENGHHFHTRPGWMPRTGRHLIFLDEFNRISPDAVQPMLTFLQFGRINEHTLPEGCAIVLAGNYDSKEFFTSKIKDKAIVSRCCHLDWQPTTAEWLDFMDKKGDVGSKNVASFIREFPQQLRSVRNSVDITPDEPDPRGWAEKIAILENENLGDARYEVYAGCIGTAAASAFMSWKANGSNNLTLKEILENYQAVKDRVVKLADPNQNRRMDILNQPIDELMDTLKHNNLALNNVRYVENFKSFMLDLPMELVLKINTQLSGLVFSNSDHILGDPSFAKKIKAKALKEKEHGFAPKKEETED